MAKVLLLDEELSVVQMVGELLRSEGHHVVPFTTGTAAIEGLPTVAPDLVIANVTAERTWATAQRVLQKSRSLNPPALVIVITAPEATASPVEAIRRGAYDYLTKPFTLHELKLRVQRALFYQAAFSENVSLRKQLQSKTQFREIIGQSNQLQDALSAVERAADSESCILIYGQSGTGKELIARAVHFKSRRRLAPFVAVDCAIIPESRMDAQLFGQRKGLVGEEHPGLIQEADGGTLFLNAVHALPIELQTRLFELLTDRQIRLSGDSVPVHLDVRVLTATNVPLDQPVAQGKFLRDLFQKLSEVAVMLPSLQERSEDIPLLIAHFLEGKVHRRSGHAFTITPEAVELCCGYSWPGNVRELEQAMTHACNVSQTGSIQIVDLPRPIQQLHSNGKCALPDSALLHQDRSECASRVRFEETKPYTNGHGPELTDGPVPLKQFLRNQEISYLQRTLAHVGGSKERAAELLGISLATMYRKLSEPADGPEGD